MAVRATLRLYHVWLGWLVGIPMLFWTVSGLVMVAKPIDEVRGADLIAPPAAIVSTGDYRLPNVEGRQLSSLRLEQRAGGPRWVLNFADGETRLADPKTGRLMPDLGAADAASEVQGRYRGTATVTSTDRIDPNAPPLELRKAANAWRVSMSDDTHFYVDARSGEIIAKRTGWWRIYDFMWGIHIMDLQGREDTNNPWVITFGAMSAIMTVLAIVLLVMTTKKKPGKNGASPPRANA